MNTERAAVLANTLEEFRQNRHRIRGIQIISDCCPTCDLDSGREFALDAVPLLPHSHCTNPEGCQCLYTAVPKDAPSSKAEESPTIYPPADSESTVGLPAYLKTPAAAMIAVGAAMVIGAIALISNNNGPVPSTTQTARTTTTAVRTTTPLRRPTSQTASIVPDATFSVADQKEDPRVQSQTARDIQAIERTARENEAARQAQAIAVQQQSYLQTMLASQQQAPSVNNARKTPTIFKIGTAKATSSTSSRVNP
jgi:CCR4-NOT transcriptional regulation complex NOT5 subunit